MQRLVMAVLLGAAPMVGVIVHEVHVVHAQKKKPAQPPDPRKDPNGAKRAEEAHQRKCAVAPCSWLYDDDYDPPAPCPKRWECR
jgi:uncharacterized short protein YbdD (DUF466 family)